jgi:orotidine-5'-phosphate decarboxylase
MSARQHLAFALDYPSIDAARAGVLATAEFVGVIKVGLELFVGHGPAAIDLGRELGCDVFLDLKLHDIPETVERAVARAAGQGVRYLTLHAAGGPRMLEQAAHRAQKENTGLVLLAITVLTSLDATDLGEIGVGESPERHVQRMARLARAAGIPGLVCSAAEVGALRQLLGPDVVLVTPGIRPVGSAPSDDQKRVGTPAAAIHAGASLLVIGRPIRDARDPQAAARAINREIAEALS